MKTKPWPSFFQAMVLCWVPYNFLFLLLRVWDTTYPRHMISSTLNFGLVNYRNLGWIRSLRLNSVLFIFCTIMTIPVYDLQITEEFQAVNISVKTDIWRSEVRIIPPVINSSWHFIVPICDNNCSYLNFYLSYICYFFKLQSQQTFTISSWSLCSYYVFSIWN